MMHFSAPLTLANACQRQALRCRAQIAFHSQGGAIRFAEMHLRSNQVAAGLEALGVVAGDRVAILAKDGIANYEVMFGCAKANAVLVPLNWRLASSELSFMIADSEARVLFLSDEFSDRIDSIRSASQTLKTIITIHPEGVTDGYCQWRESQSDGERVMIATSESPVVQIYTSGTTGNPKGVVLANKTFFDLLAGMHSVGDCWMGLSAHDTLLLSLPQFHIGGMWWAVQGFLAGATGVLIESFIAWQVLELIEKHRISKVAMVPAMIQFTLAEPAISKADLSSVTGFLYGGSPITPSLLRRAMQVFACEFFQIYGLTETGNMAVCLRPFDHRDESLWAAAGRPLPGVSVKVIDADNRELPVGKIGEICLRSPSRMLEYWKNADATDETLRNDWIHTGDAGYLNEHGFLFVCDRVKDMIIYAGENIYPAEIEAVLSEHPGVAEVAVIGVPDERWGESIKAIVVPKAGQTIKRQELVQHVRQRLADFKVPKSFDFAESLPRNPSGKVLKRKLREPFWQGRERLVN